MSLTLDATLQTAQDGDSHHIIAEIKNAGGQAIPFDGKLLTAETTDESNPNVITHSTGRICTISVFGTDKLQYIYSDIARKTFETTVTLDDTTDLGLGGAVTITDCSIVELADATIGLVFVCYDGSNYYLRQSVLSIAGVVASNALIETYAISTYPEIRSPFCILMASGDYLLVYIIEDTTPEWNVNMRTCGDFSTWSAEAAITPAGITTAEKHTCSLCQIDTDDIFLLFDYTDATDITNCYYSISADDGSTWGSAVAITDYATTSKYSRHPIAAQQATTQMHIVYNEIATSYGSYAVYDTTAVDAGSKGFRNAVFDGRYVYFVPYDNGAASGQITRYDTTGDFTAAGSWAVYDTTAVHADSKGFYSAVYDGSRYIYFVPYYNGAFFGQVTRYDTTGGFTAAGSYAVYDTTAVHADSKGFSAAVFDGRYIYFVPYINASATLFGQVTRYDTTLTFTDAGSWAVFDATAIAAGSKGFSCAVYDGRYVYFVPLSVSPVLSWKITRYDTTGTFTAAGSWVVYDATVIDPSAEGFTGAVYDGSRYIYFVSISDGSPSGHVTRYDTTGAFTDAVSWAIYDTTEVNADSKGFEGAVYDGRYLYLVPRNNGAIFGQVTRYDTQGSFTSAGSWSVYDTTAVQADSKGFWGAVYDDRYIYFVPNNNGAVFGQVTRYDTQGETGESIPITSRYKINNWGGAAWALSYGLPSYSVYNTTAVQADSKGFLGAVYDDRYIYFVPYNNGAAFGQVTRYDTQGSFTAAGSYAVYDTTGVNANSKGFHGAIYDGSRYIYFIPHNNGAAFGQITRYDTMLAFTDADSWAVYDTTAVNANSKGFRGGAYDGRYIYFAPYDNGAKFGQVTRYDTQGSFTAAGSYAVYDTTAPGGDYANSKGFWGAVYDGRYVYFVPNNNGAYFGQVTRYDTTLTFTDAGAWSIYDTATVDAGSIGFRGAVYDGSRYIYFVPYFAAASSGQVTRYDTQGLFTAAGSWAIYDTTAVHADSKGFEGAVYDGSRYIYFVPNNNGAVFGQVTLYDTQGDFTALGSWAVYDTTAVHADSKGFSGAVHDGSRYLYYVPYNNGAAFGQITRYDTKEDFNGAAPKFLSGTNDADTVICLEPTTFDFYAFWKKTVSGALSLKWAKEFTSFDLSPYLASDKDIIIERTIDNKPARLSFTLAAAQHFDESNVLAMLKVYLDKGAIITCRLGENVASTEYWQAQGTFIVKNRGLSYKERVMPTIQVTCEDSSSPLEDMELLTTRQYNGVFPETIIEQILNQKGSIDHENISISTIDDRTPLYCSWTNAKIMDIVGAICDRFGYFLRCDVDNSFDVKKITDSASTDHTYSNRKDILQFIPDNDFSDYVNRIIVQSEERLFSQVTYPEKEIKLSHGTIGWWQGNEEIKIPYADDYSLQCLNAYPIIKNLKGNFVFKDKLNWTWTPDASNTFGILKLEAPLLIAELAATISATLALGKIPIIGNFINAAGLLEIFRILSSVTNWQATIMAQPIGYVKASVEGIYDDEDFQTKIGRTVARTISEPLAYTDAQCSFVAKQEMMITRLQRSRVTVSKIGHLQDEEGDTISVIHPISQSAIKIYITNLTRRVRIPSKSDTAGGMFDTVEGWQL